MSTHPHPRINRLGLYCSGSFRQDACLDQRYILKASGAQASDLVEYNFLQARHTKPLYRGQFTYNGRVDIIVIVKL